MTSHFTFAKSRTDSVRTPTYILDWMSKTYGPSYFDPCPLVENWSADKHTDGLAIDWKKINFVNPPFSKGSMFLKKVYKEAAQGRTIVFLCKTELTGRKCFRGMCDIIFFKTPVSFPGYGNKSPRFVCCLLLFHKNAQDKYFFFESLTGSEFN